MKTNLLSLSPKLKTCGWRICLLERVGKWLNIFESVAILKAGRFRTLRDCWPILKSLKVPWAKAWDVGHSLEGMVATHLVQLCQFAGAAVTECQTLGGSDGRDPCVTVLRAGGLRSGVGGAGSS